jgi:hypothetical protein
MIAIHIDHFPTETIHQTNKQMTHDPLSKSSAFLSRPHPGQTYKQFKERIIQQFKDKGWLAPEKADPPQPQETFAPGDHVIAINTDMSTPFCGPPDPSLHPFRFPNGPLRKNVIYHVESVRPSPDGNQSLEITDLPIFWGPHVFYWISSRFRTVDTSRTHAPKKRRR